VFHSDGEICGPGARVPGEECCPGLLCREPDQSVVDGSAADARSREGSHEERRCIGCESNDRIESVSDERRRVFEAQSRIARQSCQNGIGFESRVGSQAESASGEQTLYLSVGHVGGLQRRHGDTGVGQPQHSASNRVDEAGHIFVRDHRVRHSDQHSVEAFEASRSPARSDVEAVAVQRDVDYRSRSQPKAISKHLGNDDSSYLVHDRSHGKSLPVASQSLWYGATGGVGAGRRAPQGGWSLELRSADAQSDGDVEVVLRQRVGVRGLPACHAANQQNLPFVLVGAGLPNLPRVLSDAVSYAERLFDYRSIGRLGTADATAALVLPATGEDVQWESEAVDIVLGAADGYPYFIQQFGQTAWDTATTSPISSADASTGVDHGRAKLDNGFFRARWDRATPAEREYMAAMAVDRDVPSESGAVAKRLGKVQSSLGPARANLIAKGIVWAPEHGQIAFSVPGMAAFIERELARS
jgi:hypothetical protein